VDECKPPPVTNTGPPAACAPRAGSQHADITSAGLTVGPNFPASPAPGESSLPLHRVKSDMLTTL
jgi:hypothetical protein